MSRIVEGIKELLKGKDDDEHDYRYRYDKRQSPGSSKHYGYPAGASAEGRNGYPAEGRNGYPAEGRNGYSAEGRSGYPAEGRSGYPVTVTSEGRGGYQVTVTSDGRGGFPANSVPDARSGYPANSIPAARSGYPVTASPDGRSGYPANSIAEGRSGYAGNSIADGRSGYPVNPDGRSGYPASPMAEGRSGYAVNGAGDGRSGYPVAATADGRSAYPANSSVAGRGGYPATTPADGRGAYPANSVAEARGGYPVTAPVDARSAFPANSVAPDVHGGYPANAAEGGYRKPFRQALDDDYVRSSYDTRTEARGEYRKPYESSSPRGSEFRKPYGVGEASPRVGSEYGLSPRREVSPRGEYVPTPQQSPREYRKSSGGSVIEFMVPMCCEKCKEKVQEGLSEVDGVETVRCDPKNSRVIVTGDKFIDIDRCLTKLERAVKKRCELISNQPNVGTKKPASYSGYYEAVEKSGILSPPVVSSRPSPSSRPGLIRMPSFASGKVIPYDVVGPRGQDYEAKDYNAFRRMPSFSKHRAHEAEYITGFDERPEPSPSARHEFAPIRRMPSFNRHRHHDAEYISADDRDYSPRSFYEPNSSYTSAYNDRPNLLSQVSFSGIPVENPQYVKHVAIGSAF